jgi:hypothetical protein
VSDELVLDQHDEERGVREHDHARERRLDALEAGAYLEEWDDDQAVEDGDRVVERPRLGSRIVVKTLCCETCGETFTSCVRTARYCSQRCWPSRSAEAKRAYPSSSREARRAYQRAYRARRRERVERDRLVGGARSGSQETLGESKLMRALVFLTQALDDGEWHESAGLKVLAGAQGIGERTLKRAASQLADTQGRGYPRSTYWRRHSDQASRRSVRSSFAGAPGLPLGLRGPGEGPGEA